MKTSLKSIDSGDQIQLESYRLIPEFNGEEIKVLKWISVLEKSSHKAHANDRKVKMHPKYEESSEPK